MLLACDVVVMMVVVDDAGGGLAVAVAAAVVRTPRRCYTTFELLLKFIILF